MQGKGADDMESMRKRWMLTGRLLYLWQDIWSAVWAGPWKKGRIKRKVVQATEIKGENT